HIRAESPGDPAIVPVEHPRRFCPLEVLSPASHIAVQLEHHPSETLARRAASEPPNFLPKALHRLRSEPHVQVPLPNDEPVAQKIHALGQPPQLRLPLAQPQPKFRQNLARPRQRLQGKEVTAVTPELRGPR